MKIAVIGGGAAGFFSALTAKSLHPHAEVFLFESSAKLLSKVKISGGGRCNVTHSCFDPKQLVQHYPRGRKELLGPFHRFQPQDTIAWFQERGITLKTEPDGRMFPTTDTSETIIDCFLQEANRLGVKIRTQHKLKAVHRVAEGFHLEMSKQAPAHVDYLVLATGSSRAGWEIAKTLGHTIQEPVPSLFTFNVPDSPLHHLSGVAVPQARLKLEGTRFEQQGPLLITHWGFSGPAALKLSAFAARYLAERDYQVTLSIDWLPEIHGEQLRSSLEKERVAHPKKPITRKGMFGLPKSLWRELCHCADLSDELVMNSVGKNHLNKLCGLLKNMKHEVRGKTTNKEEFVTAGGITLSEVQFKTMESRLCPGLFFCGEILDIDGVTGGFNFQNAWTSAWIAGHLYRSRFNNRVVADS